MKPADLLLRCYANKHGDQWQAFCVDLCLAAQGDSFHEVKLKLENMIADYIKEALGEDRNFANELLNRKAPLKQRMTYAWYMILHRIGIIRDGVHKSFKQPMPLVPVHTHE